MDLLKAHTNSGAGFAFLFFLLFRPFYFASRHAFSLPVDRICVPGHRKENIRGISKFRKIRTLKLRDANFMTMHPCMLCLILDKLQKTENFIEKFLYNIMLFFLSNESIINKKYKIGGGCVPEHIFCR